MPIFFPPHSFSSYQFVCGKRPFSFLHTRFPPINLFAGNARFLSSTPVFLLSISVWKTPGFFPPHSFSSHQLVCGKCPGSFLHARFPPINLFAGNALVLSSTPVFLPSICLRETPFSFPPRPFSSNQLDSKQSPRGSIHYVEYEGVDGGTLMDESGLGRVIGYGEYYEPNITAGVETTNQVVCGKRPVSVLHTRFPPIN
jgi:hypothetical protein